MRHSKTRKYNKRNKSKKQYKKHRVSRKRLRRGGNQNSYIRKKVDFNLNLTDKKGTGLQITGVTNAPPPS